MKKVTVIFIFLILLSNSNKAQDQIGNFLRLGLNDANKITEAYLNPYGEMLGVNLNSGWYTSASVHKLLGFDLTITASYTSVPDAGKTYDVSKLGLENWQLTSGSSPIAPTMSSSMSETPRIEYTGLQSIGESSISLPNGSNKAGYMITPMIQAGVGLPYHTEIMGRYMPELSLGELGKLQLWGVGIKHSIKEYIPGLKRMPILQMSVLGAYTYTSIADGMTIPDVPNVLTDGKLLMNADAITSRLLVGANLPVIAIYAGLGYGMTNSNFGITGNYTNFDTSDPISGTILGMKYKTSGFDMNAGMRVRIGIIGIHADYSVGDYSIITAGIGINFR